MTTLPSASLLIYFKDYENFHQTEGNKNTHLAGIPLVLFSLLGLLSYVTFGNPVPHALFRMDLGVLLFLFGAFFSLRVDFKLGIPFTLYAYLNYLLARHTPLAALAVMQLLGWILQVWGHAMYEKKAPAFLSSVEHLFIGPMWIFADIIGYYKTSASK